MLSRQMYKSISRRCRSITPLTTSKRSQCITTTKINEKRQLFDTQLGARYIDDSRRSISCMRSFTTINCNKCSCDAIELPFLVVFLPSLNMAVTNGTDECLIYQYLCWAMIVRLIVVFLCRLVIQLQFLIVVVE